MGWGGERKKNTTLTEGRTERSGHIKGTPISASLGSANWRVGGIKQLAAMVKEDIQEGMASRREMDCKHAARCSLIHQPADLARCHATFKGTNKRKNSTLVPDIHLETIFKRELKRSKDEYGLDLGPRKEKSLVDIVRFIPDLLKISFKREGIIASFVASGQLDESSLSAPDYSKILQKIKRPIGKDEVKQYILSNFQELYKEMSDNGIISEAIFEKLGFPPDVDDNGNKFPCNATIT